MKYVIMADSVNNSFDIPRQLTEINGERIIERTIRLLKENGVKNILVTSHDKRFDGLGVKRYEPLHNDYNSKDGKGYWLSGYPEELLKEPITFVNGDVYFSEEAIKTIVNTDTDSTLLFCTYENKSEMYIKPYDEPFAYKVVDYKLFKKKIKEVKKMRDEGLCWREPIVWELYRHINGQDVNIHKMTTNYYVINDVSCDVDGINDINKLKMKLGEIDMIIVEAIEEFTLNDFGKLMNIKRARRDEYGKIFKGDTFECDRDMYDYLNGKNPYNKAVVKLIEVKPKKKRK